MTRFLSLSVKVFTDLWVCRNFLHLISYLLLVMFLVVFSKASITYYCCSRLGIWMAVTLTVYSVDVMNVILNVTWALCWNEPVYAGLLINLKPIYAGFLVLAGLLPGLYPPGDLSKPPRRLQYDLKWFQKRQNKH